MTPILEAKGLTKRYHDCALRDISTEIPAGCVTAFFGPTGAGKTTLMKLLAHQIPAFSGTVRVFGLSYVERVPTPRTRSTWVRSS